MNGIQDETQYPLLKKYLYNVLTEWQSCACNSDVVVKILAITQLIF